MRIRSLRRAGPLVPYVACFATTWALIGLEPHLRIGELAAACALQVIVGVGLARAGQRPVPPWFASAGVITFLVSVGLLRDGLGPTPGYGPLVLLPVVWVAVRKRPRDLVIALVGAVVVLLSPMILVGGPHYPSGEWRSGALLVVIAAVMGSAVLALVEALEHQRDAAGELLAAQHGLEQIATLVATGAAPDAVFAAVAQHVGALFGGALATVIRFEVREGVGQVVGAWSPDGRDITGETIDLTGPTAAAQVFQTSTARLVAHYAALEAEPIVDRFALGGGVGAPVFLHGALWGAVCAAFPAGAAIPGGALQRVSRFAELVAVAIANAQAWETITRQAATDPLTGLANRRTFRERLEAEVRRADRHGRPLSLVIFDLDHFKAVNDTHGHQAGDDALIAVACRLTALARNGELIARIGGEEFAWLMPETTQDGAYLAAERARQTIGSAPFGDVGRLTLSAGVCSNRNADSAHELMRRADQALYEAKRGGRDMSVRSPELRSSVVAESGRETIAQPPV
jgi:diguanylate cyclase (GGDEF)-like protein